MKYIYLAVNYQSAEILARSFEAWIHAFEKVDLYIVDNFSTSEERQKVKDIANSYGAVIIPNINSGYGSGLNLGLSKIIKLNLYSSEDCIFFGNSDVYPINKIKKFEEHIKYIPILNIYKNNINCNPFLNSCQKKIIWIAYLAAIIKSKLLKNTSIILTRVLKKLPCKIVAVHGSLFCLSYKDILEIHPIFNENVFLYCEELYFMKRVGSLKKSFYKTKVKFNHIGSVSTGEYIKNNKKINFINWCNSVISYINEKN